MTRAGRDTSIALIIAAALAVLVAACGGEGPSAGEGGGPAIQPQNPSATGTTETSTTGGPEAPENPEQAAVERTAERYLSAFGRGRGNDACEQLTEEAQAVASAIGNGECAAGIETLSEGLTPGIKQQLFAPVFGQVTIEGTTATVSFVGSKQALKLTKVGGRWLIKSSSITNPKR